MTRPPSLTQGLLVFWLTLAFGCVASIRTSEAQVRISPGPLSRAHASIDGVATCGRCHGVSLSLAPDKCLSCHKAIADRVARKVGVHRDAGASCARCHQEHRGVDVDLRRVDPATFDHATETGFPLTERHATTAQRCGACHKQRSFLGLSAACNACHRDPHKATLGDRCLRCHSTAVPFKETRLTFDHSRATFQLIGAHRSVPCEKCHRDGQFKGLKSDTCASCHEPPHRHELGPACTRCHTPDTWKTRTVDHLRTGFPLMGLHASVACEKCHTASVKQPLRHDRCAQCHADPHRGSIKDDCRQCHSETGFGGARFDHRARAGFELSGKHETLACRSCHKHRAGDAGPPRDRIIDFAGASRACVSCHADRHKGAYGSLCEACHRPVSFNVSGFTHPRDPEFFQGRHQGVACVRCHVRPPTAGGGGVMPAQGPSERGSAPTALCATCHKDPHQGQMARACVSCHAVDARQFAPVRFSHDTTTFPLAGRHMATACGKCHPTQPRAVAGGEQSAVRRYAATPSSCRSCHSDPHLGQVSSECATCHSPGSFKLLAYRHTGMDDFFGGFHGRLACRSCHRVETGTFPAGRGTAVRLKVGRACANCHPYHP